MNNPESGEQLARRINLPLLVLYGLGTILGAGIYVLVGKVAGSAGLLAPLSFVVAALIALLTALSYNQLVVLFPKSAGEAVYVEHGFHKNWLTISVGLMIIFTGIVSSATLTKGFIGYFVLLVPVNEMFVMFMVVIFLGALAAYGIAESVSMAAFVTLIEVLGLVIVIFFCADAFLELPSKATQLFVPQTVGQVSGVLTGAFLAFYAFIGFEDMVNVVEEVKQPEQTMPKAIIWVVIVSIILYVLVALVATLSLPLDALAKSKAPLADLLQSKNATAAKVVAMISVLAIVNGVLIQIIMASRVCYGMSNRYGGPAWLHRISRRTRTPLNATAIIVVAILLAALFFPLTTLAKATSFIVLIVFSIVNLSLWRLQKAALARGESESVAMRSFPFLAAILCIALLLFQVKTTLGI
jgi:amino acid transporter